MVIRYLGSLDYFSIVVDYEINFVLESNLLLQYILLSRFFKVLTTHA